MKYIIHQIINGIAILAMAFFAIPKLLGKPQSMAGFKQFENAIGVNAELFMVFTGISELIIATLILAFAVTNNLKIGKLAYGFLLITMITALGMEFFARPEPKIMLVIIAIVLAILSVFKLKSLKN